MKINGDYFSYKIVNEEKIKTYDFQKFKTVIHFEREMPSSIITLNNALFEQLNLTREIDSFK